MFTHGNRGEKVQKYGTIFQTVLEEPKTTLTFALCTAMSMSYSWNPCAVNFINTWNIFKVSPRGRENHETKDRLLGQEVPRAGIFKHLWSPGIDSKEWIPLCSLAGRYDNPIPPRFLAPIDSLKIPAHRSTCTSYRKEGGGMYLKTKTVVRNDRIAAFVYVYRGVTVLPG